MTTRLRLSVRAVPHKGHLPGRSGKRGHFFQNQVASTTYNQIVQLFDMLRKIG